MMAPAKRRMTSLSRTTEPFKRYSLAPSRCTTRSTTTSLKSISKSRLVLSKTTLMPARLIRGKAGLPPQMRSSPFLERMLFMDCSPSTNRNASATLDFPLPLGHTTATIGEPNTSSVFFPKDLKPESSMDFRYIDINCTKKEDPQVTERVQRRSKDYCSHSVRSKFLSLATASNTSAAANAYKSIAAFTPFIDVVRFPPNALKKLHAWKQNPAATIPITRTIWAVVRNSGMTALHW